MLFQHINGSTHTVGFELVSFLFLLAMKPSFAMVAALVLLPCARAFSGCMSGSIPRRGVQSIQAIQGRKVMELNIVKMNSIRGGGEGGGEILGENLRRVLPLRSALVSMIHSPFLNRVVNPSKLAGILLLHRFGAPALGLVFSALARSTNAARSSTDVHSSHSNAASTAAVTTKATNLEVVALLSPHVRSLSVVLLLLHLLTMLTHVPPSPYLLNLSLPPDVVSLLTSLVLPLPLLRAARAIVDKFIHATTTKTAVHANSNSKRQLYSTFATYAVTSFYLLHSLDTMVSHFTNGATGLRSAFVASSLSTVLVTLALQPLITNVVAGIALPLQNKFAVGDSVLLSQSTASYIPVQGVVQAMGVLDCVFVKEDGVERVAIGNLEVLQGRIRNLSREEAERKRRGKSSN